jgi:mono/diheme cytochrome c family protein
MIITISVLSFSSCYYDKSELLYGGVNGGTCADTTAASYSQKIVPLLQQNCYSCHAGSSPSGNQPMGTHATDKAMALNGKLVGTINHASGYSPMPAGKPKMNSCQIAAIKKWVDNGSLNN